MKIIVETSTLISASIFWKSGSYSIKHPHFDRCSSLFEFLRGHAELGIITKTIEDEAKNVLDKAVITTIRQAYFFDIREKIRTMTLQDIITNHCLDRLEDFVEECSTRLPINIKERDRIKREEIEPFLQGIVKNTVRYVQPHIPGFIKAEDLREELTDIIVKSLPAKGIVYKGMPADRDLTIMAEATLIWRKHGGKERVYIASMDNHFIPNKVQVGSFLSGYKKFLPDQLDSTVRDKLAEKFGFIGDDPLEILKIAEKEIGK
jgi:phosphotransferase system IIB component